MLEGVGAVEREQVQVDIEVQLRSEARAISVANAEMGLHWTFANATLFRIARVFGVLSPTSRINHGTGASVRASGR